MPDFSSALEWSLKELIVLFACASVAVLVILVGGQYWDRVKYDRAMGALCEERTQWERRSLAEKEATLFPVRIYGQYFDARVCLDEVLRSLKSQLRTPNQPLPTQHPG